MLNLARASRCAMRSVRTAVPARSASSSSKAVDDSADSFTRGIFSGKLVTKQVSPYPAATALDEESSELVREFVEPTAKFFREVNKPLENDATASIPEEILESLKELGAFGLQVPVDLGGVGLSNTGYARLIEEVDDFGVGITLGAHQSIGFKGILLRGNQEQKEKYLPDLASGKSIAAFCLTEPTAGSDASSIRTRAVKSACGKHYVLNGSKIWISNGGTANVFTVFAQMEMDDPKKPGEKKDRMCAFIVERKHGVTSGPPENKMGIRCSNTAELYFDDVKVPAENLLGEEGEGFKIAMQILNNGRFGMSAALTGTMKKLMIQSIEHAKSRVQFGSTLDTYGTIQGKLAEMATLVYATESLAYTLSANMDKGVQDYQLEAAISKIFASEAAWKVCDETIQILGGMGFMRDAGVEKTLRDLRIFRIFEGSNEILRLFVALGGIQSASQGLKGVQRALKNPLTNLGLLASGATKAINLARGVPEGEFKVSAPLQSEASAMKKLTALFGHTVSSLIVKHKNSIIHEQLVLQRVADSAIDMFAMAAVLSRASDAVAQGTPTAAHETALAQAFCHSAAERVERNLLETKSASSLAYDALLTKISKETVEHGSYKPQHPLGF